MKEKPNPEPPIHPWGRCKISKLQTITAGTATVDGVVGADWSIFYNKQLPTNYISKSDAEKKGWKPGKWPSNFVPGEIIGGEIIRIKTNIYLMPSAEFGMKLILIIKPDNVILKEYFGRMTV